MPYATARSVTRSTAALVRPPRRVLPSVAASTHLRNERGAFDISLAPMMREPLDELAGRRYQGIVFAGPARSSKTFSLVFGSITWIVTCAPGDTLVIQMSRETARDFSRMEVDRVIGHTPALKEQQSPRAKDDNTFDKYWRSGTALKIGWPSKSQVASKTLQYGIITDYDRSDNIDSVDGEGTMFDLLMKRLETYMSRGKCIAESSPGRLHLDARWRPSSPHEAPPVAGILGLYNRGTRARWYWRCPGCARRFEATPGMEIFRLPSDADLLAALRTTDAMTLAERHGVVPCPHCGMVIAQDHKRALNDSGVWLHEGESFVGEEIVGERRRSNICSYWLGGAAATYQRWDSIVLNYLQALLVLDRSGDEEPLKKVVNTDAGAPFTPRSALARREPDALLQRVEQWQRGSVPDGVRFLVGAVDVQAHRFVVEVWGFGVGLERWLVDRRNITRSRRREPDDSGYAVIEPAAYAEDWDVLRALCVDRYDGFAVALTLCDSGGQDGVTTRAYQFWRGLRAAGLGTRMMLVKGAARDAPRAKLIWPDSTGRSDRDAGARGDVPVWQIHTDLLKDAVAGDLERSEHGPGYVHIPQWVIDEHPTYLAELLAEVRTAKGWRKVTPGDRNEALDLAVYSRAAVIALNAEQVDWARPPEWVRLHGRSADHTLTAAAPAPAKPAPVRKPRIGYLSER